MKIEKPLLFSILSLGITTIITQIVLLREFLSVFYGNELVIGIILANWMILTGFGACLGKYCERRKINEKYLVISFLILSVLPIITLFLLDYLRNIVFTSGSMVGVIQIFYSSFILLLPFCIVSGLTFTLLATLISLNHKLNLISEIYALESIGSITGGIISSFIFVIYLKTYQSLIVLLLINLSLAVFLSFRYGRKNLRILSIIISIISLLVIFNFNLDDISKKYLFKEQEILFYKDTPYGNLTITKQGNQKNFFENNVLLFSTNDPTTNEEAVHYAMIQHPDPKTVLLIGGGITGTTREILKYNVYRIDYVEVNPWIISAGKFYTNGLNDKRINVINEDGRLFVKSTTCRYDVALINLPEPITAQLNRFYTIDFFGELKSKLNKGAVVSLSLLTSTDYISPEAKIINSIIYNSLKKIFRNILIVPGMKSYFIASDNSLDIHIGKMIEQRGIKNLYVNQYYLDDQVLSERSNYIKSNIEEKTKTNKDLNPVSYYRQIIHWLSYFDVNYWIPAIVILCCFAIYILRLSLISFGMFCGGFAASSIEVILLIAFQVIYGYVYQTVGIIITIFMAGLAVGSFFWQKIFPQANINSFIKVQFSVSIYAFVLPLFLIILKYSALPVLVVHTAFYLLLFIIALLVGLLFSLATKIETGSISKVASKIYSVDLIGSAFGALLISAFLIPIIGLIQVSIIIGLLNFFSSGISYRKKLISYNASGIL
jgi:spermidine synthase